MIVVRIEDELNWDIGEFVEVEMLRVKVTGMIGCEEDTEVVQSETKVYRVNNVLAYKRIELEEWGRL